MKRKNCGRLQTAVIEIIAKTTPGSSLDLIDNDIAQRLCEPTENGEIFRERFDKLLSKHAITEDKLPDLITSLLMHIKQGLHKKGTCWDKKTAQQREKVLTQTVGTIDTLITQLEELSGLATPMMTKFNDIDRSKLNDAEQQSIQELESELKQTAVRRPFIAPETIPALKMQKDLIQSNLYLLNKEKDEAGSREVPVVPSRSYQPDVAVFIRTMGRWFTKYFGSPHYEHILSLCFIYIEDKIHDNFDTNNVKSVFNSSPKILKKIKN